MDDKLFEISERGVTTAFESVNDTCGWGMVNNKNRFFASHQLRRFNATTIGETRFGDMIHGRVFSKTTQAYYKQNPRQIKEDYKKYIEALTIYEVNMINSEEFEEIKMELEQKTAEISELQQKINDMEEFRKEVEDLTKIRNELSHVLNDRDLFKTLNYLLHKKEEIEKKSDRQIV